MSWSVRCSRFCIGCSEMCVAQTRVLILSLSGDSEGSSSIYNKNFPPVLERMDWLVCTKGYQTMPFLPLNWLIFWFTYLGLALLDSPFIVLVFLFLEPHCLYKAPNHVIISKLMHHFYLQCPLYVSSLIPQMLTVYYPCW